LHAVIIPQVRSNLTDSPDSHPAAEPVRAARFEDLPGIHTVDAAVFGDTVYQYFLLRQMFEVFGDHFLVVESEGRICGYALFGVKPLQDDAVLLAYAILPAHRDLAPRLHARVSELCEDMPVREGETAYRRHWDAERPETMDAVENVGGPDLIRMARPDDLGPLAMVDAAVFRELTYPFFALRQFFELFEAFCVVAESEGRVCGYALIGVTPDHQVGWLLGLGVVPESRGRKFGKKLLQSAVELCARVPVERVKITVRPTNKTAERIYEKAGFVEEDFEEAYFGEGEPRRILSLKLGSRNLPPADQQGEEDAQREPAGVAVCGQ
jgi:ribosomal-protein-alanine N-acetyltransferase